MGYIKHEAIIVTGWNKAHVRLARQFFKSQFLPWNIVSTIVTSPINGYYSFFVAPDGSKMGWGDDQRGDEIRDRVKQWILEAAREPKPMYLDFVEVRYGGDDEGAQVLHVNGDLG
jgi:hypothetical protein